MKSFILFLAWNLGVFNLYAQGSLFIIGGGDRPPSMMKRMVGEAKLQPSDYIAVLTMSSANPDTSYYYIKADLKPFTQNQIVKFHFTPDLVHNKPMLDSVKKSKLIFITGGVQSRFMNVVLNTPVYDVIHEAYDHGAMIAGTSAGAAVMSEIMITGNQIRNDTIYDGSFDRIMKGNIETTRGLGFLTNTIIDQHFVVRSRYNRLLTLLYEHPAKTCIGIDEDTAILIKGKKAEVIGSSQVLVLKDVKNAHEVNNKPAFTRAVLSIHGHGEKFKLK